MSTFLLGTFLTAETKGKFTCRISDFSIFHVAFLDRYFDSILANRVESFFWLFHIKYVIFDVLVSDLLCFHWPKVGNFIYPMMHRFILYYQASERT